MLRVQSIWFRTLTTGDFFNIERAPGVGPQTGGGQTYVDIPKRARQALFRFFGVEEPTTDDWPSLVYDVAAVGIETSEELHFELNRKSETRYRIANQARQFGGARRHPAWTQENGFPAAPDSVKSKEEAEQYLPAGGIRLYLVQTDEGLFAGYAQGTEIPESWPSGVGLEALFTSGDGLLVPSADGGGLMLQPEDIQSPFRLSNIAFEAREALLILDLYMRRGALPVDDPSVAEVTEQLNALPGRDGVQRTATEVSERLASYAATDQGQADPEQLEDASTEVWEEFAGDEDLLSAAAQRVIEGQPIPPRVHQDEVTPQRVKVEALMTPTFVTKGREPQVSVRREQELVKAFEAFLNGLGHSVVAHRYPIPGQIRPLQSDLFDETSNSLYEAKGSVTRESIRMAIGELADYYRFEPTLPRKALLLPREPAEDLIALATACDIRVVWRDNVDFSQSGGPPLW